MIDYHLCSTCTCTQTDQWVSLWTHQQIVRLPLDCLQLNNIYHRFGSNLNYTQNSNHHFLWSNNWCQFQYKPFHLKWTLLLLCLVDKSMSFACIVNFDWKHNLICRMCINRLVNCNFGNCWHFLIDRLLSNLHTDLKCKIQLEHRYHFKLYNLQHIERTVLLSRLQYIGSTVLHMCCWTKCTLIHTMHKLQVWYLCMWNNIEQLDCILWLHWMCPK